ncbi:hypothetical protein ACVFI8_08410 [Agarivorans sp. MS3-6]
MLVSTFHRCFVAVCILLLSACSTGYHGSFVERSFYQGDITGLILLGPAQAEHCQSYALYLFPLKHSPSTQLAIKQAKRSQPNTVMLADISISDTTHWKIGYAQKCINVTADAYGKPPSTSNG